MTDMTVSITLNMPIEDILGAVEENFDEDDLMRLTIALAKLCKKKETICEIRDFYAKVAEIYEEAPVDIPLAPVSTKYGGRK